MTDSSKEGSKRRQEGWLIHHILELRRRIIKVFLVFISVFLGLIYYSNDLYLYFSKPLREYMPADGAMIATGVSTPFLAPFKLTAMLALFITIPVILHQVWSFIAPGLYKNEKKFAIPILLASVLLFYIGVFFSYYIVFPTMFSFFISMAPKTVLIMTDIAQYLDFSISILLIFGLSFEIPIGIFLVIISGVVSVEDMKKKRPGVIVGCFVLGMLLTPPDVLSQSMLAIPMWGLFELGLLISSLVLKYR